MSNWYHSTQQHLQGLGMLWSTGRGFTMDNHWSLSWSTTWFQIETSQQLYWHKNTWLFLWHNQQVDNSGFYWIISTTSDDLPKFGTDCCVLKLTPDDFGDLLTFPAGHRGRNKKLKCVRNVPHCFVAISRQSVVWPLWNNYCGCDVSS